MTQTPKHPSKRQAQRAAAALSGVLDHYTAKGDAVNTRRVTAALAYTRAAALTESAPERSRLMGMALLNISTRAAAQLLAQREGGTP